MADVPDFTDRWPLFGRTEAQIRESMDLRANEGLAADDPDRVDVRPHLSPYWMHTQPVVVELAAAYDRLNDAAAAAFIASAWDDWLDRHAASYGQLRVPASPARGELTFTGADGTLVATNTPVRVPQTDPDVDPPEFETTAGGVIAGGTLTLPIQAVATGPAGNVPANSITLAAVPGVSSVANADAVGGGSDEETDASLKKRLVQAFRGTVWGTKDWYRAVALQHPGVGYVDVFPHRDGAGTVAISIRDDDGEPAAPSVVASLQEAYGTPGAGDALAPGNHYAVVEAPTALNLYASASIQFEPGFNLDGSGGAVALGDEIRERYVEYVRGLGPAATEVVYNAVRKALMEPEGVHDVASLALDTVSPPVGTADVPVASTEVPRVADVDGLTLTEAP